MYGKLSDAFDAVVVKYLSHVDIPNGGSNQHEIGGLVKAGLGTRLNERCGGRGRADFAGTYVSLADGRDPIVSEGTAVWYDARAGKEGRSAEYRLYYPKNEAVDEFGAGDLLLVALCRDERLLLVCAPRGSDCERQVRAVFGIESLETSEKWSNAGIDRRHVVLPLEYVFAAVLGIVLSGGGDDGEMTKRLLDEFGGDFPKASCFSAFARRTVQADPLGSPDSALVIWQEQETHLFRLLERHLLSEQLNALMKNEWRAGVKVDEFISIAKSALNRRKSRAGLGFQNHIEKVLKVHGIRFVAQGRTERNERPDILIPSEEEYRDLKYDEKLLRMLAAKTTLKERWSQVCREADRIKTKHIITIDPSLTPSLIAEIAAHDLQLVVPSPLQTLYPQKAKLMTFADFLDEVKSLGHVCEPIFL